MNLENIREFFCGYWHLRRTWRGWLLWTGFLFLAYLLLPLQIDLDNSSRAIFFGGIWFLSTVAWLIWNHVRLRRAWTVKIALDADANAEQYLDKALKGLRARLGVLTTQRAVKFEKLPPYSVSSTTEADAMVKRGEADIVIWGRFTDAERDAQPISQIEVIYYTTRLTPAMRQNLGRFQQDMHLALGSRDWLVRQRESLDDLVRLQRNFAESCLFVIAIQMFTSQQLEDAATVADYLLNLLGQGQAELSRRLIAFFVEASYLRARLAAEKAEWKTARQRLEEIVRRGIDAVPVRMLLAVACYELGDESCARSHVERIAQLDANSGALRLDRAFFAIRDRDYAEATSLYDAVHRLSRPDFDPKTAVGFFERRMREGHPDPAFLYARGVIELWYLDRHAGVKHLQEFLRATDGKPEYATMAQRAQQLCADARRQAAVVPSRKRRRRKK